MKKLLVLFILMSLLFASCGSLWSVKEGADIEFKINKSILSTMQLNRSGEYIGDDDVKRVTICLYNASNDSVIESKTETFTENQNITITFVEIPIVGQRVYASATIENGQEVKEGKSKTATIVAGTNYLHISDLQFKVYAIGETAPGGGTILYSDSTGAYREVSPLLAPSVDWDSANNSAEEYSNNGYDDWYLPTMAELNQAYKAAKLLGHITEESTLWSSEGYGLWDSSHSVPTEPSSYDTYWIFNLTNGDRSDHRTTTELFGVRAVRSYNPVTYKIGDTGPGGGVVFWVGDNNAYKEVSPNLGENNWYIASGAQDVTNSGSNPNNDYIAGNYTGGDFNDWYLPNATELSYVFVAKEDGYIDEGGILWSSSEYESTDAWLHSFTNGYSSRIDKLDTGGTVRAIRAFMVAE